MTVDHHKKRAVRTAKIEASPDEVLSRTKRKQLGAFYTPEHLAEFLAGWAIRTPGTNVLEPSVGDGILLRAALKRIDGREGGAIVGIEIDKSTFQRTKEKFAGLPVTLFNADFLTINEGLFRPVDALLANPPFTRNHSIDGEYRKALREAHGEVFGAAGLWVYFLLGALTHLRRGGRIALVAPGAAAFADYAKPVLELVAKQFSSVSLLTLSDRVEWSGGAQERAVLILADGFQQGPAKELVREEGTIMAGAFVGQSNAHYLPSPIRPASLLSELAELKIGAVTGSNRHFLLSDDLSKSFGLPAGSLHPILSRARHVKSLEISKAEVRRLSRVGERTLLLLPGHLGPRHGAIRNYLARIPRTQRKTTLWFNKRHPWWRTEIGEQPDGIFTYMNNLGPVLALIENGVATTNTLHQVRFKDRDPRHWRTVVASMLTSYAQLSAEHVGRVYGGGVLKFELKNARSLQLLVPCEPISEIAWSALSKAFGEGDRQLAQSIADEAILPEFFGEEWRDVAARIQRGIDYFRNKRGLKTQHEG